VKAQRKEEHRHRPRVESGKKKGVSDRGGGLALDAYPGPGGIRGTVVPGPTPRPSEKGQLMAWER